MIDRLTDAAEDYTRENRTQNGILPQARQTLVEKGRARLMVAMDVPVRTGYSKHMERYEIFTLPGSSSPNGCTTNRL